MTKEIKVRGLKSLSKTLRTKIVAIKKVNNAMKSTAFRVERDIKISQRVDKGILRNSTKTTNEKALIWKVSAGVDYAIFQEEGTRFITGNHLFALTLEKHRPALIRKIKRIYS